MENITNSRVRGNRLSPEQRKNAQEKITAEGEGKFTEMLSKYQERPKTPEEQEDIVAALTLLQQEVLRLCGENGTHLVADNIHILDPGAAKDIESESRVIGGRAYTMLGQAIVFDFENVDVLHKLHTIIHEATHLLSRNVATMEPGVGNELTQVRDKAGYEATARITPIKLTSTNFQGVNEAMTEHVAFSIITDLFHRQEEIFGRERFSQAEFLIFMGDFHRLSGYAQPMHIMESIVRRVARTSDRDEKEVWDEFTKGLFTGSMMQLRVIEKIYGKGSLRYLAEMPMSADEYDGNTEAYEREIGAMRDYFS